MFPKTTFPVGAAVVFCDEALIVETTGPTSGRLSYLDGSSAGNYQWDFQGEKVRWATKEELYQFTKKDNPLARAALGILEERQTLLCAGIRLRTALEKTLSGKAPKGVPELISKAALAAYGVMSEYTLAPGKETPPDIEELVSNIEALIRVLRAVTGGKPVRDADEVICRDLAICARHQALGSLPTERECQDWLAHVTADELNA